MLSLEYKEKRVNYARQLLDMFEPNGPERISDEKGRN